MDERRKYPRVPTDQLLSFTAFTDPPGLGEGADVSLGGIRFKALGSRPRVGDLLRVSFNLGEETINAVGRVVWTKPLDDIGTEVGLEFVRLDPWAARLLERAEEAKRRD